MADPIDGWEVLPAAHQRGRINCTPETKRAAFQGGTWALF